MYTWIWRHLPGNLPVRVLTALVMVLAVSALLLTFAPPAQIRALVREAELAWAGWAAAIS